MTAETSFDSSVELVTDTSRGEALTGLLTRDGVGRVVGLALLAAGVVVLAVAWARSSELADVPRQMPLLISGGLTGIGLVVVGVTAIALDATVRQSAERRRRADAMTDAVTALQRALEEGRA
ncbi:MAG: hypothetical protein JWO22_3704 [Frankiales bacterium]|nr:hypothetical protein [Frankiales bacterium]